jgi:hypothetical protein
LAANGTFLYFGKAQFKDFSYPKKIMSKTSNDGEFVDVPMLTLSLALDSIQAA